MGDAGEDARVELGGAAMGVDGFLKESAETEDLDQAGKGFGFAGMTIEAGEDAGHSFSGATGVDLDECVELVGWGKIGVDGEGSLEGGLREVKVGGRTAAEFV